MKVEGATGLGVGLMPVKERRKEEGLDLESFTLQHSSQETSPGPEVPEPELSTRRVLNWARMGRLSIVTTVPQCSDIGWENLGDKELRNEGRGPEDASWHPWLTLLPCECYDSIFPTDRTVHESSLCHSFLSSFMGSMHL